MCVTCSAVVECKWSDKPADYKADAPFHPHVVKLRIQNLEHQVQSADLWNKN